MSIRELLFAVLLLAGAVLARPALPEDELAALSADLADDLEDLDDARAVDEAYERLFATAATPAAATATLGDDDYDGEMPQGDQPMPDPTASDASINASAESTAATSDPELTAASGEDSVNGSASTRKSERESIESPSVERDRELRLQNIKSQVLSYLGLSSHSQHPMSNISASQQQLSLLRVVGRMNLPNLPPQDIFAEKVQSHYPSCSLPRNTDETLWSGGSAMHLLFDLPNHPPPAGTSVNVVQATLRLYKVSQSNATLAAPGPLCLPSASTAATPGDEDVPAADAPLEAPLETPLDQLSHQLEEQGGGPLQTLLGMATADDRQVRVSVYWYTRSLKKNKNGVVVEKRKLLDSRMLPVQGSAWTEWNVRMAVKVWRESGRNFGLVVEVEDEDGTLLDAHQFFNGMNCTQEASTARPLPSFLLDAARRLYSGNASGGPGARAGYPAAGTFAHAFNQNLFPVIDLCTVETTDGSGGALYSSGYDTAPLAASRTQQQPKLAKHRAHPAHPQPAKHRQGDRQGDRPPHHKHRHQHQDHDDSREHEEHQSEEPQARRWPRARSGPQGDVQAQADDEDIRQLIIPRGIVMTAKHVQHVTRDTARAR